MIKKTVDQQFSLKQSVRFAEKIHLQQWKYCRLTWAAIMKILKTLMDAKPDILNHNIETVRRLTPRVRARATYERSLELLQRAKEMYPEIPTKSSLDAWTW